MFFLSVFVKAGSLGYIRDKIRTGAATLANFSISGRRYYFRLLGLKLLFFLMVAATIESVDFFKDKLAVLDLALELLIHVLLFYFLILLAFSPNAIVVDEKTMRESIKMTTRLFIKNIYSFFIMFMFSYLIVFLIAPMHEALERSSCVIQQKMIFQIVSAFLSSWVSAFFEVVLIVAWMSFYLSLPDRNNK